jgi:hypothetical protein
VITTTDAQVMAMLKTVVSERPDYVYSAPEYMITEESASCFYVHADEDGSPVSAGCIVGAVLNRLGVPLEDLQKYEGATALQMVRKVADGVSKETGHVLRNAQFLQDGGSTWGEAYLKSTGESI